MPKKKTIKETVEPDYRQQSLWDLDRTAENVCDEVHTLYLTVSELGSIIRDLTEVIDVKATAIVEAIEKHTAAITEREWEKRDVD